MEKISIQEKFAQFQEEWTPKIIAESNGQLVKLAKGSGEFVWHKHDKEDELFLVIQGKLTIQLKNQSVELNAGEMIVIPKGTEHCPMAELDTHFMIIEPKSTCHTGNDKEEDISVPYEKQEWI